MFGQMNIRPAALFLVALAVPVVFSSPAEAQMRFRPPLSPPSNPALSRSSTPVFRTFATATPAGAAPATISRFPGTPLITPSVANQAINPNFRLANGLSLPQAAFNAAVIGRAISQIPPFALGFNSNPQLASFGFGGGLGGGLGGGYPMMYSYPMTGYGGYGDMSNMYSGGYADQSMSSPYSMSTDQNTDPYGMSQAGQYPATSATGAVREARLEASKTGSMLVSSSTPEKPSSTRDVWLYDNYFSPPMMMVPAGTTVRWINYGYHRHSVTSRDWDSGPLERGAEFSVTFTKPGTYQYSCRYHPSSMMATITVTR